MCWGMKITEKFSIQKIFDWEEEEEPFSICVALRGSSPSCRVCVRVCPRWGINVHVKSSRDDDHIGFISEPTHASLEAWKELWTRIPTTFSCAKFLFTFSCVGKDSLSASSRVFRFGETQSWTQKKESSKPFFGSEPVSFLLWILMTWPWNIIDQSDWLLKNSSSWFNNIHKFPMIRS
jgi:hypothetical protein